ncbi:MAG: penicillin-binding transpeptidase domain-containing protein [Terriglobales bacterium]
MQVLLMLLAGMILTAAAWAASRTPAKSSKSQVSESPSAAKRMSRLRHSRRLAGQRRRRHHRGHYERFYTSSFSDDVTSGDVTPGENPVVRAAAVEALGNMNGAVVAIDPLNGRVLAMVNQKLALSEGAQPCSTFKLAVALAALNEKIVDSETELPFGRGRRRWSINLTRAIAISNNTYFEELGRKLGFERVSSYARQFGLGELAGYNIQGEHLGEFPEEAPSAREGGVAKMCSYGESISMTPLQLGAMVSAIANGGTLFYLQHPQSPEEAAAFRPKVKRQLDIAPLIPEMHEGMLGATQYGSARSVRYNFSEEEVLGKTGTCSNNGTRYGWFASYANTDAGRIVLVVFLRGGRPTFGPKAAEIAGRIYRNLYDHSFFAATTEEKPEAPAPAVMQ